MSADESIVDLILTAAEREDAALRQAEEAERARDTAQRHAQDAEQESAMLRARIDELERRLVRFRRGGAQRSTRPNVPDVPAEREKTAPLFGTNLWDGQRPATTELPEGLS